MIRIGYSCIYYPVAMGKYFEAALRRRGDVEVFSVGPYTGSWIPWNNGMHLPAKYAKSPDLPLPQMLSQYRIPFAYVQGSIPKNLDLWVVFDAGWDFQDRPDANMVVRVQSDPHVLKGLYDQTKYKHDFDFCMQGPYMREGEHYLPYAYDPTVFYPQDLPKEFDACLIGLHYTQRDALVERLRSRGLKVHYSIGESYDENRELYNRSKIALCWTTLQDLPARVWEAFGMGLPLVTNRVPDLNRFFVEGEDYLGFNTLDEAEKQVITLLTDYERAKRIGQNAYQKVREDHTWDSRCEQLLQTVGLL